MSHFNVSDDPTEVPGQPETEPHPHGILGEFVDQFMGPGATRAGEAAKARAEQLAQIKFTDTAGRSRHIAQMRDQQLRKARAEAFQAQSIAVLFVVFGAEIAVLLPLLFFNLLGWVR